jgi:hypothetical protein
MTRREVERLRTHENKVGPRTQKHAGLLLKFSENGLNPPWRASDLLHVPCRSFLLLYRPPLAVRIGGLQ